MLALLGYLGDLASIGSATVELSRHAKEKQMEKTLVYVGAGVLALGLFAFIEHKKKTAAIAASNAAIVATAPQTAAGAAVVVSGSGAPAAVVSPSTTAQMSATAASPPSSGPVSAAMGALHLRRRRA